MKILSRKDAISAGEKKYFTGIPCKNGHLAERYTQSSSCESCVHPKTLPNSQDIGKKLELRERKLKLEEEKLEITRQRTARLSLQAELALTRQREREINKERLKTKSELIGYKIRLWDKDVSSYREIVFALSSARQPALHVGDVFSSRSPTGREGSGALYFFHCFIDDRENLYEIGKAMYATRKGERTGQPLPMRQMQPGEYLWSEFAPNPQEAKERAKQLALSSGPASLANPSATQELDVAELRRQALESAELEAAEQEDLPLFKP